MQRDSPGEQRIAQRGFGLFGESHCIGIGACGGGGTNRYDELMSLALDVERRSAGVHNPIQDQPQDIERTLPANELERRASGPSGFFETDFRTQAIVQIMHQTVRATTTEIAAQLHEIGDLHETQHLPRMLERRHDTVDSVDSGR
ncbi:hypothetical protein [Sphingomonas sp. PAMC 26621]|uniref:hypothetical protein n=1 Tax=Sphingomonas sp. PAMC 26621 TaxID=1112213 RepID=UPI001EE65D27|nr:hypothetical protein [Sphingomonas sp. PAMC 26621]